MKKLLRSLGSSKNLATGRDEATHPNNAPARSRSLANLIGSSLASSRPSISNPSTSFQEKSYISFESQSLLSNSSVVNYIDPLRTDDKLFTKLHKWAYLGDISKLKKFLKKIDVNASDEDGRTALHLSASAGHFEVLAFLLGAGANAELQDKDGRTPVMRAIEKGHTRVVQLLLQNKVNSQTKDNFGNTALHLAAQTGSKDLIELLLDAGLDYELANNFGQTAIHVAVSHLHNDVVKCLISHEACVNAEDKEGITPLMLAAKQGCKPVVEILIESGSDAALRDRSGWSASFYAKYSGYDDLHQFLEEIINEEKDLDSQGGNRMLGLLNKSSAQTKASFSDMKEEDNFENVPLEDSHDEDSWNDDDSENNSSNYRMKKNLLQLKLSSVDSLEKDSCDFSDLKKDLSASTTSLGPPKPPRSYTSTPNLLQESVVLKVAYASSPNLQNLEDLNSTPGDNDTPVLENSDHNSITSGEGFKISLSKKKRTSGNKISCGSFQLKESSEMSSDEDVTFDYSESALLPSSQENYSYANQNEKGENAFNEDKLNSFNLNKKSFSLVNEEKLKSPTLHERELHSPTLHERELHSQTLHGEHLSIANEMDHRSPTVPKEGLHSPTLIELHSSNLNVEQHHSPTLSTSENIVELVGYENKTSFEPDNVEEEIKSVDNDQINDESEKHHLSFPQKFSTSTGVCGESSYEAKLEDEQRHGIELHKDSETDIAEGREHIKNENSSQSNLLTNPSIEESMICHESHKEFESKKHALLEIKSASPCHLKSVGTLGRMGTLQQVEEMWESNASLSPRSLLHAQSKNVSSKSSSESQDLSEVEFATKITVDSTLSKTFFGDSNENIFYGTEGGKTIHTKSPECALSKEGDATSLLEKSISLSEKGVIILKKDEVDYADELLDLSLSPSPPSISNDVADRHCPSESLPSNIEELQIMARKLRIHLNREHTRNKGFKIKLQQMKQMENSLKKDLADAESISSHYQSEILKLKAQFLKVEYEAAANKDEAEFAFSSLEEITSQLNSLEEKKSGLRVEIVGKEHRIERLKEDLETSKRISSSLQDKLSSEPTLKKNEMAVQTLENETKSLEIQNTILEDNGFLILPKKDTINVSTWIDNPKNTCDAEIQTVQELSFVQASQTSLTLGLVTDSSVQIGSSFFNACSVYAQTDVDDKGSPLKLQTYNSGERVALNKTFSKISTQTESYQACVDTQTEKELDQDINNTVKCFSNICTQTNVNESFVESRTVQTCRLELLDASSQADEEKKIVQKTDNSSSMDEIIFDNQVTQTNILLSDQETQTDTFILLEDLKNEIKSSTIGINSSEVLTSLRKNINDASDRICNTVLESFSNSQQNNECIISDVKSKCESLQQANKEELQDKFLHFSNFLCDKIINIKESQFAAEEKNFITDSLQNINLKISCLEGLVTQIEIVGQLGSELSLHASQFSSLLQQINTLTQNINENTNNLPFEITEKLTSSINKLHKDSLSTDRQDSILKIAEDMKNSLSHLENGICKFTDNFSTNEVLFHNLNSSIQTLIDTYTSNHESLAGVLRDEKYERMKYLDEMALFVEKTSKERDDAMETNLRTLLTNLDITVGENFEILQTFLQDLQFHVVKQINEIRVDNINELKVNENNLKSISNQLENAVQNVCTLKTICESSQITSKSTIDEGLIEAIRGGNDQALIAIQNQNQIVLSAVEACQSTLNKWTVEHSEVFACPKSKTKNEREILQELLLKRDQSKEEFHLLELKCKELTEILASKNESFEVEQRRNVHLENEIKTLQLQNQTLNEEYAKLKNVNETLLKENEQIMQLKPAESPKIIDFKEKTELTPSNILPAEFPTMKHDLPYDHYNVQYAKHLESELSFAKEKIITHTSEIKRLSDICSSLKQEGAESIQNLKFIIDGKDSRIKALQKQILDDELMRNKCVPDELENKFVQEIRNLNELKKSVEFDLKNKIKIIEELNDRVAELEWEKENLESELKMKTSHVIYLKKELTFHQNKIREFKQQIEERRYDNPFDREQLEQTIKYMEDESSSKQSLIISLRERVSGLAQEKLHLMNEIASYKGDRLSTDLLLKETEIAKETCKKLQNELQSINYNIAQDYVPKAKLDSLYEDMESYLERLMSKRKGEWNKLLIEKATSEEYSNVLKQRESALKVEVRSLHDQIDVLKSKMSLLNNHSLLWRSRYDQLFEEYRKAVQTPPLKSVSGNVETSQKVIIKNSKITPENKTFESVLSEIDTHLTTPFEESAFVNSAYLSPSSFSSPHQSLSSFSMLQRSSDAVEEDKCIDGEAINVSFKKHLKAERDSGMELTPRVSTSSHLTKSPLTASLQQSFDSYVDFLKNKYAE